MTTEAARISERHERTLTLAAAAASGEIYQLPDGRAAYMEGLTAADATDKRSFRTEGVVKVPKATGIVLLDGGKGFWDHSANVLTFKKVNDRDFFAGSIVGDAASGDTYCYINLNVEPVYLVDIARDPFDTAIVGAAGSPALHRRGGAHKLMFSATDEAQKIDILSKDGFAVGANAIVEFAVEVVDNGDSGEGDFNIGVANDTHATSADTIGESCFLHIDTNALDILAESDDGTTDVAATDTTINYAEGTRFEGWMDLRDPSDVQIYIEGVLVLSGTTFDLSEATGPLKLLAHFEKSGNDTPGEVDVEWLRARTAQQ